MTKYFLSILALAILFSCTPKKDAKTSEKIICVSILPAKQITELIAGEQFTVVALIPPGVSPATFDPGTQAMKSISQARLYFSFKALGFEKAWDSRFMEQNQDLLYINLSENCQLQESSDQHHPGIDPHVWMSPEQMKTIAKNIAAALIRTYPAEKANFENNLKTVLNDIENVQDQLKETISHVNQKDFLIFHPALGYFAKEFGLNMYEIEVEGKSPSAEYLKNLVDLARDKKIDKILIQKQFDKENARIIASETGAQLIEFDPLNENWFAEMQHLAKIFAN